MREREFKTRTEGKLEKCSYDAGGGGRYLIPTLETSTEVRYRDLKIHRSGQANILEKKRGCPYAISGKSWRR